jgi:hypothetical protein
MERRVRDGVEHPRGGLGGLILRVCPRHIGSAKNTRVHEE